MGLRSCLLASLAVVFLIGCSSQPAPKKEDKETPGFGVVHDPYDPNSKKPHELDPKSKK